jgi:hypothetical protein
VRFAICWETSLKAEGFVASRSSEGIHKIFLEMSSYCSLTSLLPLPSLAKKLQAVVVADFVTTIDRIPYKSELRAADGRKPSLLQILCSQLKPNYAVVNL